MKKYKTSLTIPKKKIQSSLI